MTMAFDPEPEHAAVLPSYADDRWSETAWRGGPGVRVPVDGMTQDYTVAIEEGALVRQHALFGLRARVIK